jgi:hypothetical protein
MNMYAYEKLQELERARLGKQPQFPEPRKRRKPLFGPLAAGAGRTLRRVGEGLESWGNVPMSDVDRRVARRAR